MLYNIYGGTIMNVTTFIRTFPQNDLIDPNKIKIESFDQNHESMYPIENDSNINLMQLGVLVDYLTRLMLTHDVKSSFDIPMMGLQLLESIDLLDEKKAYIKEIKQMLDNMEAKLSDQTIQQASQLLPLDSLFRSGRMGVAPQIGTETANWIRLLVNNGLHQLNLLNDYGDTKDILTETIFPGGYTEVVDKGDGDYMTKTALIDMKVSKYPPRKEYWQQLLTYYELGLHSNFNLAYQALDTLAIVNPRLNQLFTYSLADVNQEALKKLAKNMGY